MAYVCMGYGIKEFQNWLSVILRYWKKTMNFQKIWLSVKIISHLISIICWENDADFWSLSQSKFHKFVFTRAYNIMLSFSLKTSGEIWQNFAQAALTLCCGNNQKTIKWMLILTILSKNVSLKQLIFTYPKTVLYFVILWRKNKFLYQFIK